MSTEVAVALIGSPVFVALIGAWLDVRKSRRANDRQHAEMAAKVDGLRDDMGEVKEKLTGIESEQNRHGARLATIEARFDDHLLERQRIERRR